LEDFFYNGSKKGIQSQHARNLADILDGLDASGDIKDMGFSGRHFPKLSTNTLLLPLK
jgi:toxin HigB-1